MIRRHVAALALLVASCTAPISPTGGTSGGGGDGGLGDGGLPPGLTFDAGPPLYDYAPFKDGGIFKIDGQTVAIIYWDAGVKTVVFPGTKDPMLTILYPDSSHVQANGDQNQDGVIDYTYTSARSNSTLTETEQWDHNFDGVFDDITQRTTSPGDGGLVVDETETELIDADGGYELPDAGGSWVVTASYQGSAVQFQCLESANPGYYCAGYDTLPTVIPQSVPAPGHPGLAVPINVPGACPAVDAQRFADDLRVSFEDLLACAGPGPTGVESFNYILWTKLLTAEAALYATNTKLYVFCNDTCDCTLGAALPYGCFSAGGAQNIALNFRSQTVNPPTTPLTDEQLEEVTIHEFVHFAGFSHDPEPNGSPAYRDQAYSCGRYCNGCRSFITGGVANTAKSWHYDCAQCADDMHKYGCGLNYVITPGDGNLASTGCDAGECGQCDGVTIFDCNSLVDPVLEPRGYLNGCCESECAPCSAYSLINAHNNCTTMPAGICDTLPPASQGP